MNTEHRSTPEQQAAGRRKTEITQRSQTACTYDMHTPTSSTAETTAPSEMFLLRYGWAGLIYPCTRHSAAGIYEKHYLWLNMMTTTYLVVQKP